MSENTGDDLGEIKSEEYYKSRVDEIARSCYDVIWKGISVEQNGKIRWRIAARVVTALFASFYRPAIESMFEHSPIGREAKP